MSFSSHAKFHGYECLQVMTQRISLLILYGVVHVLEFIDNIKQHIVVENFSHIYIVGLP